MIARNTFINTRFTTTFGDVFVSKQTRPDIGEPAPEFPVFFVTESQGTITPAVVTFSGGLVEWDFGDGTIVSGNNSPSHTYTDGQPSHEVKVSGAPGTDYERIEAYGINLRSLDVSPFTALSVLQAFSNFTLENITGLENLAGLQVVTIGNNPLLGNQDFSANPALIFLGVEFTGKTALDLNANALLTNVWAWNNTISSLPIDNNPLLKDLRIYNNSFTAPALDDILIKLDGHGQINGFLNYSSNPGAPTLAALTAYNNLLAKGWTITGPVPA